MSLFRPSGRGSAQGGGPQQGRIDPRQKLQELRSHPSATLAQAGFDVPDDMESPKEIINYLLESGQVKQNSFAQAMRMLGGGRTAAPRRK